MPSKIKRESLATRYNTQDILTEVGIDEAGRGSFWGPLMAAAVIWPPEHMWTDEHRSLAPKIQDSKRISKIQRPIIAAKIRTLALATAVGRVEAAELEIRGVTWANQEAFRRALGGIHVAYDRVLIDGILDIGEECDKEIITVVDGDATYLSIAAASILAKVAHDEAIRTWCEANTNDAVKYDLLSSMGYGTARHRKAIQDFGVLADHRKIYLKKTLGLSSPAGDYLMD